MMARLTAPQTHGQREGKRHHYFEKTVSCISVKKPLTSNFFLTTMLTMRICIPTISTILHPNRTVSRSAATLLQPQ